MTYLVPTLRLYRDAMAAYILAIPKTGFKPNPNTGRIWNPVGVVWHNTAEPDLKTWAGYSEAQKDHWGDNYDAYCKTTQRWHSGPHCVATPEPWSVVLCDPLADGIHDSCRNVNYFGVETVGNFEKGADDPLTGAGLMAMQSAANIIAALCVRFDWDPHTAIDFHRNCKADAHACPGSLVTDEWAIGLVVARIAEIKGMSMTATPTPIPTTSPPAPTPQTYTVELPVWPPSGNVFFQNAARCFNKWIALGLNPTVAYGLVANAEAESAFEVKAVGDNDTAYGVYQWHWTPRGAAILAATGIDVRSDPKIENHVAAAYWELTHLFAASWAQIQQAKTALDAGSLVCTMYERAGAAFAVERRGAMAERWLAYFAANPDILKDNPPQG
jgi:hypothetical protein